MSRPVVMVTGSNRNTGLGIIRAFGRAGYDLVTACRTQENAEKTEKRLREEFPQAEVLGVWFDQGHPEQFPAAFAKVKERFAVWMRWCAMLPSPAVRPSWRSSPKK